MSRLGSLNHLDGLFYRDYNRLTQVGRVLGVLRFLAFEYMIIMGRVMRMKLDLVLRSCYSFYIRLDEDRVLKVMG
jgi:hypothetical protein